MKSFGDNELTKLAKELDTLHIKVVDDLPYIGIDAFKTMFKDIHNPQCREFIISKWIELAGSPIGEVKIVDSNKKVMFIMPGIISPDLKSSSDLLKNLEYTFSESEQMNANFSGSGDAKFANFMCEIIKHGKSPTVVWEQVLNKVLPIQPSDNVEEEEEEEEFSYFE